LKEVLDKQVGFYLLYSMGNKDELFLFSVSTFTV